MKRVRSAGGRGFVAGAVAVMVLGVGGMPPVSATGPASSTFVPITPCRLMDTRATSPVGPRNTPIGPGETYSALVWGSNGLCVIPATATAITLNVTFINPTSSGFVTVFPPDQAWPGTSNLNFSAGQAPAPNGVTSPLSFDGKIGFFNAAGTVNLIADIVGYYEPTGSPDADLVVGACSGLLRWDLDHCKATTYPTGLGPAGVAFDGTNLWVTNFNSDTVSKINPTNGSKVDFPTGDAPLGVAYDGSSVWVTNVGSDNVSKINPATGARVDFPTGDGPFALAFDGSNIWVANANASTISKIDPATGASVATFPTETGPKGVAFDGSSIWITNWGDDSVSKMNPATGTKTDFVFEDQPYAIAFDGTSLWITSFTGGSVSKMDPLTGLYTEYSTGDSPRGVAFDGSNIWVTNSASATVSQFNPVDGTKAVYPTGADPIGVAFDGSNIWIANSTSNTVSKFVAGPGVLDSNPVGSIDSSAFVPITPCRLMDTRSTSPVGPRNTPIGPGETYSPLVWGSNGNCSIPSTAAALSLNVTFVGPTSSGFVTVYPPDQPWPGTSNLNFVAGQAPSPNGVTSPLSADGKIGFFNFAGTVNLIADIVGYYEAAGSAPGGLVMGHCAALLRWELPGCRKATFATGNNPGGIAFDGTSIWVANAQDDTVSKINPTTGSKVSYPTGNTPSGVAFDGRNIWVTNTDSDTVSRINPTTGARTDFAAGDGPEGVAFDGSSIWVTVPGQSKVKQIDRASGATLATYDTGDTPRGIAFDGTSLWIANYNAIGVSKMNPADGTKTDYLFGSNLFGVAFDGTNIWVTDLSGNKAWKVNPDDGTATNFPTNNNPSGIAFDGTSIWIANHGADTISKMNPSNGARVDYLIGDGPNGVAFDGGNVWVTNEFDGTVTKLVASGTGLRLSGVASEGASSFVPVTPCRLMDTRSTSQVGPRGTPILAGETYAPLVWGTNGQCTIPSTATALSLNVTFVSPTAPGFVTVFPPDDPWPGTSNLNFSAGQAPAPNGVTSPLSFDGKIGFFNAAGTVNLLADIVGYYEPTSVVTTHCLPILRWDLPACKTSSFDTGDYPQGIAFDGTYLWVANFNDDSVSRIDRLTGASIDYSTGDGSYGVAFDGTNIWVTNHIGDTVSKINPANGSEIAEYPTGDGPRNVVFDGTSIWTANEGDDTVTKMNPADGTHIEYPTGDGAYGVTFDGNHIWVTNSLEDKVSEIDPASGTEVHSYDTGDNPFGIAFDGMNLWIANQGNASDSVMKMNPSTGTTDEYFIGDGLAYFAFDGTNMWVTSGNFQQVVRIDVATGAATPFTISSHVYGIVFDGESLWYTRYLFDAVEKVII